MKIGYTGISFNGFIQSKENKSKDFGFISSLRAKPALDYVTFSGEKTQDTKQAGFSKLSLDDLPKDQLKGKKVLVRVDYNVPMEKGKVTDDKRIRETKDTIEYLINSGAKVILTAHLGKAKGKPDPKLSLAPVAQQASKTLGIPVTFLTEPIGSQELKEKINNLKNGEVVLLENIRFYPGEEKPKNDPEFVKQLASLGEVYVNDAFGAAHRGHASTSKVCKHIPLSVAGLLMKKENVMLGQILENPERPLVAILGGSKVSTKIGVLENLIDKVDKIIIGGGMTYTFMKAQGHNIGDSIVEDDQLETARKIINKAKEKGVELIFADDLVIADKFSNDANTKIVNVTNIPDGWQGLDIGPKTLEKVKNTILDAKTIFWNGPVGVFEMDKFSNGTKGIASYVAEATKNGAVSVLGGGDTGAAIEKFSISEDKFSHVSTGGGASLEFIEGKDLPGVSSLNDR